MSQQLLPVSSVGERIAHAQPSNYIRLSATHVVAARVLAFPAYSVVPGCKCSPSFQDTYSTSSIFDGIQRSMRKINRHPRAATPPPRDDSDSDDDYLPDEDLPVEAKHSKSKGNFITKFLPGPIADMLCFPFRLGEAVEESLPQGGALLTLLFGVLMAHTGKMLYEFDPANPGPHDDPLFGIEMLHFKTPIIGPMVLQVKLMRYAYFALAGVMGAPIMGMIIACFGHTLAYFVAFLFFFVKNSVRFSWMMGLVIFYFDLTHRFWLPFACIVPMLIAFGEAFGSVHSLARSFPGFTAVGFTGVLCFLDQAGKCAHSHILYNRMAWFAGWKTFRGYFTFPLMFCHHPDVDATAQSVDLLAKCRTDLSCPSVNTILPECHRFCTNITSTANLHTLPLGNNNRCLSVLHVFFCALVCALIYQTLQKFQRIAIVVASACFGAYVCLGSPSDISAHVTVVAAFSLAAAIIFQAAISCRLTRVLGLDDTPPDHLPATLQAAVSHIVTFPLKVLAATPIGVFVPVLVFAFKFFYANYGNFSNKVKTPDLFCVDDTTLYQGLNA
jgi:hypothetical protein